MSTAVVKARSWKPNASRPTKSYIVPIVAPPNLFLIWLLASLVCFMVCILTLSCIRTYACFATLPDDWTSPLTHLIHVEQQGVPIPWSVCQGKKDNFTKPVVSRNTWLRTSPPLANPAKTHQAHVLKCLQPTATPQHAHTNTYPGPSHCGQFG